MSILSARMYVDHLCAVPLKVRRRHQIPQKMKLQMTVSGHVGMLSTELRSSAGAASDFNYLNPLFNVFNSL